MAYLGIAYSVPLQYHLMSINGYTGVMHTSINIQKNIITTERKNFGVLTSLIVVIIL